MTYIEYSVWACALWGECRGKGRFEAVIDVNPARHTAVSAFKRINTSIQSSLFSFGACGVCRRSRSPRSLKRRSAAARLLGLRVRIQPEAWVPVSCECCVLSGRGLCDGADPSSIGVLPSVCVCVSLCVIRCSSNPLHLKWIEVKTFLFR